jgi:hypothetical protein
MLEEYGTFFFRFKVIEEEVAGFCETLIVFLFLNILLMSFSCIVGFMTG